MAKILQTKPITIKEANLFISKHHRHHRPTTKNCGKWAISVINKLNEQIVGVAICANPVSATYMDGYTLEITRLCVSEEAPLGTASFLLSNCAKIWQTMGGKKIITYTLDYESGASLKGAGWDRVAEVKPHNNWKNKSKLDGIERDNLVIYQHKKYRWEFVYE
ncbi:XF1762 family protein [Empedobacter brevis]